MGFLMRLRRDTRGATLAVMAGFMVPMIGFSGVAVDAARLYVVKVRLQQACDAGVLAGRRAITDTTTSTLETAAQDQAQSFFRNNFNEGWVNTAAVSFTPVKTSESQVAGTAQANVPMTLMRLFGAPARTLTVNCEARYDVADTDIIFVLDTTGSMACLPSDSAADCTTYTTNNPGVSYTRPTDSAGTNVSVAGYPGSTGYAHPEKAGSRIAALRTAVVDFYNTMAANVDPTTKVRYGFVTYTSTVNAGRAISDVSSGYMVSDNWDYQTRRVVRDFDRSSTTVATYNNSTLATCNARTMARSPAAPTYDAYQNATQRVGVFDSSSNKCVVVDKVYGPRWEYGKRTIDVSQYVTGAAIVDPSKVTGVTSRWEGCIEERDTDRGATTFSSPLPADLDPDLAVTSRSTRWRPMWPDLVYYRPYTSTLFEADGDGANSCTGFSTNLPLGMNACRPQGTISCGKPVRRLSTMTLAQVTSYVNASDFRPSGGTYHDTGMIWGLRLLSPSGPFAADTAAWPNHQPPNRVIVFLTDGDMSPGIYTYGMYGMEILDKRVTNGNSNAHTSNTALKPYHNARFLAVCQRARQLDIDVWTVALGMNSTTELTNCASAPSQALATTSGSGLSTAFVNIAKQVAMLRISR